MDVLTQEENKEKRQLEYEWERIWYTDMPSKLTPERVHDGLSPDDTDANAEKSGVVQQVNGLMKSCRLLMNEGQHERAAELAREAFALDPERVMADPLIYKMHLLADTPAKQSIGSLHPTGASEASEEPPTCPYCPRLGKPIQGVLPKKKKNESGPTTLLVPARPPVAYEVVPAGAEEASEPVEASSLYQMIEATMDRLGLRADGSRLSGEWSCGGHAYHFHYKDGCLMIWKTPNAGKIKP